MTGVLRIDAPGLAQFDPRKRDAVTDRAIREQHAPRDGPPRVPGLPRRPLRRPALLGPVDHGPRALRVGRMGPGARAGSRIAPGRVRVAVEPRDGSPL